MSTFFWGYKLRMCLIKGCSWPYKMAVCFAPASSGETALRGSRSDAGREQFNLQVVKMTVSVEALQTFAMKNDLTPGETCPQMPVYKCMTSQQPSNTKSELKFLVCLILLCDQKIISSVIKFHGSDSGGPLAHFPPLTLSLTDRPCCCTGNLRRQRRSERRLSNW